MHQVTHETSGEKNEIWATEDQFISKDETCPSNQNVVEVPSDDKLQTNSDPANQQPRKKLKLTEADKKRSVRMFGSLMGTLTKFQDETSKTKQTEAAKRRAAVESRLQTKLKLETEALHQLRAFEVEQMNLKQQVLRKADELGHLTEMHSIQFANKLAFSNYLRTSIPSKLKTADQNKPPLTNYGRSSHLEQTIFWLPFKLLPEQKELIEDQRRITREEVEESQHQWEEERLQRQADLTKLEENRDIRLAQIEEEKALARVQSGSVPLPSIDLTSPKNQSFHTSIEEAATGGSRRRGSSEIRQDTPEVTNENGRDEDAVEY